MQLTLLLFLLADETRAELASPNDILTLPIDAPVSRNEYIVYEGVAVIVEPRSHPQLSRAIYNVATHLPMSWRLHLMHGTRNSKLAATLGVSLDHRLALTNLGVRDLAPKDTAYNQLLTSPRFWYCLGF